MGEDRAYPRGMARGALRREGTAWEAVVRSPVAWALTRRRAEDTAECSQSETGGVSS